MISEWGEFERGGGIEDGDSEGEIEEQEAQTLQRYGIIGSSYCFTLRLDPAAVAGVELIPVLSFDPICCSIQ